MDTPEIDDLLQATRSALVKMTRDSHLIDDLSQAVLIKCLLHHQRAGCLPSVPYAIQMAKWEYCTWWRRKHLRKRATGPLPEGFDGPCGGTSPGDVLECREVCTAVRMGLEGLPHRYGEVARLHLIEGWPLMRIAQRLRVARSTVKRWRRCAVILLRQRLRSYRFN